MSTLLNQGIYDAHEVARLLAVDTEQVVRWATADARGDPPIASPTMERAFAFRELVSLTLAQEIRRGGVDDVEIRRGLRVLREEYGVDHPLASRDVVDTLATSGSSLIARQHGHWFDIGKGRQGTFKRVVELYLNPLVYDEDGWATAFEPAEFIVLDPRIQAGAPCIAGTRIPTATLHALLQTESVDEVADEYDLTPEQVEAANAFEQQLNDGVGLAA